MKNKFYYILIFSSVTVLLLVLWRNNGSQVIYFPQTFPAKDINISSLVPLDDNVKYHYQVKKNLLPESVWNNKSLDKFRLKLNKSKTQLLLVDVNGKTTIIVDGNKEEWMIDSLPFTDLDVSLSCKMEDEGDYYYFRNRIRKSITVYCTNMNQTQGNFFMIHVSIVENIGIDSYYVYWSKNKGNTLEIFLSNIEHNDGTIEANLSTPVNLIIDKINPQEN